MSKLLHCNICKNNKPSSQFNKRNIKRGFCYFCRACSKIQHERRYYYNHDLVIKRSRQRYKKNPDKNREAVWKMYGIVNSDGSPFKASNRLELYNKQKGCCAICGKLEKQFKRRLSVDHDHKSGVARGLLCFRCNKILVSRHTVESAARVYKYLKETT